MDENTLELLEIYIEMTEKQDEIISRMGELLKSYATEIQHLRNLDKCLGDDGLEDERRAVEESVKEYEQTRDTD